MLAHTPRRFDNISGWILALFPFALAAYFFQNISAPAIGFSIPWFSGLGIHISFHLDGLSLLFCLLISGIGALVVVYASAYLKGHPQLGRFYFFLFVFMASMLGVVTADNLILLFVFWELTSLSSYFLIGFNHENETARRHALQALLVTGTGGLCLLAGSLLMGMVAGTYEISELIRQGHVIRDHPLCGTILVLVLIGAFCKSAQFPFHFWLPNAMVAPAPVSAYLHSSTMVKAGIYLLARVFPIFGDSPAWIAGLTLTGSITILTGIFLSLRETDMKRQLAYMTVTALGLLVMLLGIGSPKAIQAAMTFLLAHALYKGALFMIAGAVDHATHCRDAEKLSGLAGKMPFTAVAAFMAGLSLAAIPPFFGFIAKEMAMEAALKFPGPLPVICILLAGAAFAFYFPLLAIKPFFGRLSSSASQAGESPAGLWVGSLVLAFSGLLFGLFPAFFAEALLASAVGSITGGMVAAKLELWHGLTPALWWSAGAVFLGLFLYPFRQLLRDAVRMMDFLLRVGPEKIYNALFDGLLVLSKAQTQFLQNGYLRRYIKVTLVTLVVLSGWAITKADFSRLEFGETGFFEIGLSVLIMAAALAATFTQRRFASVAYMGVIGLSVTLLFLVFGAPDLAMTQFVVDTLTVILLALVLHRLPDAGERVKGLGRLFDVALAAAAGIVMFLFVLLSTSKDTMLPSISKYFAQNSLSAAHGRNIVNVILVDFRAIDTLGEITVLAVSAIGVYSLLKLVLREKKPNP